MYYDYLIVGAGLYGAVFAHEAVEKGKKVFVIDKRNNIGGNIYTEKIHDIDVHKYGAHIFHTSDKKIWDYVSKFVTFNNFVNSPVAVYKDELYNLPFNMNTFSKMWGIKTPAQAKEIIEKQRLEAGIAEPKNLEEQAISMVGRDIYEKLVEGYTGKQWGRKCTELPSFIIKRLPVRFTYDNNYFSDRYQGIPEEGYTALVEKLLKKVINAGCIRLGVTFKDFIKENEAKKLSVNQFTADQSTVNGSADGDIHEMEPDSFGKIIYTGMIDEYFDYCLGELQYRSLRFEEEYMPKNDNYQGNAVVNYTEYEVPYTRIIEHKHFNFNKCSGTVITREYPVTWKRGDEPFYPINDERNSSLYAQYKELADKEENVIFGGRLGQYKYYDMDKVIAEALKTAEEIL